MHIDVPYRVCSLPATLRVLFDIKIPVLSAAMHSTTVPFALALAVNLKVEVMSAKPFCTVPTSVRVAR